MRCKSITIFPAIPIWPSALGASSGFISWKTSTTLTLPPACRSSGARWHISLSTWFRSYLYIPLGGNRKGKARTLVNLMIVFLCTGLWHGANWQFVAWGVYYGLFLIAERLWLKPVLEKHRLAGHIYTLVVVLAAWVIFRAPRACGEGGALAEGHVPAHGRQRGISAGALSGRKRLVFAAVGILLCGPVQALLPKWKAMLLQGRPRVCGRMRQCSWCCCSFA